MPQRIYIPKGMVNIMFGTTKDSTSINFRMGHHWEKHGTLLTTEDKDQCDELLFCENIARLASTPPRLAQRRTDGGYHRVHPVEEEEGTQE